MDPEQRKGLKQMVKARERAEARARFPLPDDVLEAFFAGLEKRVDSSGCDDTRRPKEGARDIGDLKGQLLHRIHSGDDRNDGADGAKKVA